MVLTRHMLHAYIEMYQRNCRRSEWIYFTQNDNFQDRILRIMPGPFFSF